MTLEGEKVDAEADGIADIERALASFGYRLAAAPVPIGEPVLNENYRVETDAGPRFLQVVRRRRAVKHFFLEQRLLQWVAAKGIPVVPAELAGDGRPFARPGAALVQLYPWVDGRAGGISAADAALAGETQARIHLALAGFDDPDLPRAGADDWWDTEHAIQVLSRVDDLIRYYPSPPPESLRAQETLRFQLELLESDVARSASEFANLPVQACHGDYHSRNVLISPSGELAAVIDWEFASAIPPVYELLRALSFSGYLDPPLVEAYLRGYGSVRQFSTDECVLGVEMWWQHRIHAIWSFEMRFIRGERGVAGFFENEDAILRRFADRDYRSWLVTALQRHAGV